MKKVLYVSQILSVNSLHFSWSADSFLFVSEWHCLLFAVHGFHDTHLLTHSWYDIAHHRVGTFIGRRV